MAKEYSCEFLEAARYGVIEDMQLMFNHERLRQLIDFRTIAEEETRTSPLMYAAANGHFDCLQFLIENVGVSINDPNTSGNTALHWAALNGHAACVSFLIAKGANVLAENKFGRIPFDEAMERDMKDCCEIIVQEEVRLAKQENVPEDDECIMQEQLDSVPE